MLDTARSNDALLASLRSLSDDELVCQLKGLAARERRATALVVAHLAELDTRDVYLRAGYSSLFVYCCDVLALSEHEALNRIEAARAARRFPMILDLLEAGEINLTTVRLLAPHLTALNRRRVLDSARGKKKARVEEIVAVLSPRPDVPASVRKLPGTKPAGVPAPGTAPEPTTESTSAPTADGRTEAAGDLAACPASGPDNVSAPLPPVRRSAEVRPLSPDRYKYELTIGGSTLEKLRLAKDMLRHALPAANDEAVLEVP